MDCESFGKYLDNYENLTEQEKSDMEKHAAKCEECRAELDFFMSMISTAKSLPKIEPPADFMDKLNTRLDAEDKRVVSASKIKGHLRRYGIQYAAAAACLALVTVITANRSLLTDRMDTVPDGIISEETTVSDGSARDGAQDNIPVPSTATAAPTVSESNAQPSDASKAVPAEGNTEPTENAPVTVARQRTGIPRTSTPSVPAAPRQTSNTANEPAPAFDNVSIPAVTETHVSEPSPAEVSIPTAEQPDEANGAEAAPISSTPNENNAPVMTRSVPDDYTAEKPDDDEDGYRIALASVVNGDDAPETYDLRAEEVSESLKAAEIQANYSLAGTDNNDIARGKYSKLNKDGIPIADATAIGSIKFSYDDEERAMAVINRYTVDKEDDIYVTDSVNLNLILSKLRSEGIPYTDYTIAGSGEVKFQIKFK